MCQRKPGEPVWRSFSLRRQLHENSMQNPYHYRVHSVGRPHAMFQGRYLTQLHALALTDENDHSPTAERPPSNAGPQVASTTGRTEELSATSRPPGRRRRLQRHIQNTPTQIAPRLTEQDPRMAGGAVVFDCRPAVLPVYVDVSGIDMRIVRPAKPPAEPVLVPPNVSSNSEGGFV